MKLKNKKSTPRWSLFCVNTPPAVQNVEARWTRVPQTDWPNRPVISTYLLSCSDTYNGHKSAIDEQGIIWTEKNQLIRSCDSRCYSLGRWGIFNWTASLSGHFGVSFILLGYLQRLQVCDRWAGHHLKCPNWPLYAFLCQQLLPERAL